MRITLTTVLCACRYKHLRGKRVVHPLDGRLLPIITDAELVDMNFGTGAVKITPAHDLNDFAAGKRHNLDPINILTDEGYISEAGGQFAGQNRFEVRALLASQRALLDQSDFLICPGSPVPVGHH